MIRIGKILSVFLLYYLLGSYSLRLLGMEDDFTSLLISWFRGFHKLDVLCIHWIALHLAIWIYAFVSMLWLESKFTLYLYIRQRTFWKLFLRRYLKCVLAVFIYYGGAILLLGGYFILTHQYSQGLLEILFRREIAVIYISECLESLNICLIAYFIYCLTKRAEIGMILALAVRLTAGFIVKDKNMEWYISLYTNLLLVFGVLYYSGIKFYERIRGEE